MEPWEIHYLHAKAVRDALCYMHDITPPEDKSGQLTNAPEICSRKYDGKKFWEAMQKAGHSHARFEECSCHPRRG